MHHENVAAWELCRSAGLLLKREKDPLLYKNVKKSKYKLTNVVLQSVKYII